MGGIQRPGETQENRGGERGRGRLQPTSAKAPDLAVLCSRVQGSVAASGCLCSWTRGWGRSGSNTFSEPVDQRAKKEVNVTVISTDYRLLFFFLDLFNVLECFAMCMCCVPHVYLVARRHEILWN